MAYLHRYHLLVLQILLTTGILLAILCLAMLIKVTFDALETAPVTGVAAEQAISARTAPRPNDRKRCPYCVERGDFKMMARTEDGDWYKCDSCSHIVMPNNQLFECRCVHCYRLGASHPKRA